MTRQRPSAEATAEAADLLRAVLDSLPPEGTRSDAVTRHMIAGAVIALDATVAPDRKADRSS